MKRDISASMYQKCSILYSKILLNVLHNTSLTALLLWQWVPELPHIKSSSCHLWRSITIFADSTSYAWSGKHINMLARVWDLVKHFSSWKSLTYWNQVGGDWKRVSCLGNRIFYSHRCFSCRNISLPSFNVLNCKLAKIALCIYSIWYGVECMTLSVISFAYFTHFSNLNLSPELMQIFANGKKRLSWNSMWYAQKHQGVKIWS